MDASWLQGWLALADNLALHPLIQIIDCKKQERSFRFGKLDPIWKWNANEKAKMANRVYYISLVNNDWFT